MNISRLNGAKLEIIGYMAIIILFVINILIPYVPWGLF